MTLTELERKVPKLLEYTRYMPEDIRNRCTVRTHAAGSIIHQKNMELGYFGIVAQGENRVINAFENGNVYMIESNKAIDFIGEVTENVVAYISRKDAERWLSEDINILRLTSRHTAFKLYRSSYNNGAKLFYPPGYLLLDYMVKYGRQYGIDSPAPPKQVTISRTRQLLQEEIGINVKTLNRTIRQLKEEGFFTLYKGKITFNRDQYEMAQSWLETARDK